MAETDTDRTVQHSPYAIDARAPCADAGPHTHALVGAGVGLEPAAGLDVLGCAGVRRAASVVEEASDAGRAADVTDGQDARRDCTGQR